MLKSFHQCPFDKASEQTESELQTSTAINYIVKKWVKSTIASLLGVEALAVVMMNFGDGIEEYNELVVAALNKHE
ncbi:hypothetical protein H5410_044466 [Solanum commersonii]|uniref:Uncharacterized protein n=1 Tax=Solanum commersonii TaxID=4109 RepID=A0A9J5XAZ3_SOLCO|nr:hypothetical protein H5410_044466 [Solanum commersonii]